MPAVPFPDFGGLAAAHALGSPNQAAADVEEIHEPVPGRRYGHHCDIIGAESRLLYCGVPQMYRSASFPAWVGAKQECLITASYSINKP